MKVLITYEYLSLCFNSNALYTTAGPGRVRTYLSGWHYGFKGAIQPSKLGPALPSLPGQSPRYSHCLLQCMSNVFPVVCVIYCRWWRWCQWSTAWWPSPLTPGQWSWWSGFPRCLSRWGRYGALTSDTGCWPRETWHCHWIGSLWPEERQLKNFWIMRRMMSRWWSHISPRVKAGGHQW